MKLFLLCVSDFCQAVKQNSEEQMMSVEQAVEQLYSFLTSIQYESADFSKVFL